jgi:hypothetical protein
MKDNDQASPRTITTTTITKPLGKSKQYQQRPMCPV